MMRHLSARVEVLQGSLVASLMIIGSQACSSSSSSPPAAPVDGGTSVPGPGDGATPEDAGQDAEVVAQGGPDAAAEAATASPDAGHEGGVAAGPCDGPGIVLCDDFEGAAIDTGTWTEIVQGQDPLSSLAIDTSKARTGKQSIHSTISMNSGRAMLSETRTFPAPMNKVYGRAYIYFDSPVITAHAGFVVVEGSAPFISAERFGAQNGNWLMNFVSQNTGETGAGGVTPVKTGSWLCVQWTFDGAGSFTEWVDGVKLDASDSDPTKYAASTFDTFRIGMEVYGSGDAQPAYDLWFDDVAIGTQPIDCLP